MTSAEFGFLTVLLLVLLCAAHVLGHCFSRLAQPRVVGEILAGVLFGPSVIHYIAPELSSAVVSIAAGSGAGSKYAAVVGFLYYFGLILLMFAAGAETQGLFRREDRCEVAWLGAVGTGLPFVAVVMGARFVPLDPVMGAANDRIALLLVLGIAFAVTSIPVISRIFHDLRIGHTRFARLVLGVAVVEDIVLWGVLAVATGLAAPQSGAPHRMLAPIGAAVLFFVFGLTTLPRLVRAASRASSNAFARDAPVAYVIAILLACSAVAAAFEVNVVFAAFLAGFAVGQDDQLVDAARALNRVSFAVFIPLYFAIVGYHIDLVNTFSLPMIVIALMVATTVKMASAGLGARLAGFPWPATVNLAVALNARGGPGIVLAGVAHDARIINGECYTTLVVVAVVTSQAAGAWLDYVLRRGYALLNEPRCGDDLNGLREKPEDDRRLPPGQSAAAHAAPAAANP